MSKDKIAESEILETIQEAYKEMDADEFVEAIEAFGYRNLTPDDIVWDITGD